MESTQSLPLELRNVWRAYVTPPNSEDEITVYVEAHNRAQAHAAVRHLIAALLPNVAEQDVENTYYNLFSASEIVDFGVSDNVAFRLFEAEYNEGRVWRWERKPIFAVRQLSAIYDAWQEATQMLL